MYWWKLQKLFCGTLKYKRLTILWKRTFTRISVCGISLTYKTFAYRTSIFTKLQQLKKYLEKTFPFAVKYGPSCILYKFPVLWKSNHSWSVLRLVTSSKLTWSKWLVSIDSKKNSLQENVYVLLGVGLDKAKIKRNTFQKT